MRTVATVRAYAGGSTPLTGPGSARRAHDRHVENSGGAASACSQHFNPSTWPPASEQTSPTGYCGTLVFSVGFCLGGRFQSHSKFLELQHVDLSGNRTATV